MVERRLRQLEMEKLSLKGEDQMPILTATRASKERLEKIEAEIYQLSQRQAELSSQWQNEKHILEAIKALKLEEEQLRVQIEQAERDYDLNKAAQLKYGRLETVQRDREAQEAQLLDMQAEGSSLLREQVTEADIAEIVSDVPVVVYVVSDIVSIQLAYSFPIGTLTEL